MKTSISTSVKARNSNASTRDTQFRPISKVEQIQPELIEFQDIELEFQEEQRVEPISPSSELVLPTNDLKKVKINQYLQKAREKYLKEPNPQRTMFRRETLVKGEEGNNNELLKQELNNIEYETVYHREIEKFMMAFATHPEKAVQHEIDRGILKDTPRSIAQYLVQKEAINKDKLGEYFGENNPKVLEVLREYCRLLNFRDLEFDKSLRLLLSKFKIPGEAQKIERIVEVFAEVYYQSHSHEFQTSNEIHILSYALIMLNSDAHNPNQHNKMTLHEFIKNTSPVCPTIPKRYLEEMYERIVNDKFETEVHYVEEIYNRLHMLNLNVTISGLSKVLSNVMELMKGHVFIKFCVNKIKSVQRKVYVSQDQKEIRWVDANNKLERYRHIKTQDITDLVLGCSTQVMKYNKVPSQFDSMCFSIITTKRSLDLKAKDTETRSKWVNYIGALLIQKRENKKRKEEGEFKLHFSKEKIEEKWNTEIFTHWDEHWDYKLKRPKALKYEMVHNVLKGFCCGSTNEKVYTMQEDSGFFSNSSLLSTLWKFGLPESSRKTLWPVVIGNNLGLTSSLYEMYKKKKRHLPEIQKLPYSFESVELVELLAVIRPDISLVRNLLQISDVFSRYLSKYDAFSCFMNTMHKYHFLPFFQGDMNEIQFRIQFFEYLLQKNIPYVSMHFKALEVNTRVYFVNWFLSVFSHCFGESFLARIWDNFLLEGELFLFKVGLTLVKYYEFQLKLSTFDNIIKQLTQPKHTSEILFFKILDDWISISQEEYDDYIEKRKHAIIKTKVQEIPLYLE